MATIKEKLSTVRNTFVAAMLEIGTLPTFVIVGVCVILLLVGGWFAWGGIADSWKNYKQDAEIKAARKAKADAEIELQKANERAIAAEVKVNELEKQRNELQLDYNIVFERYQNLRTASDAVAAEYDKARRAGLVLNGGKDLSDRFSTLNRLLDGLDADTNAKPDGNR